MKKRIFILVVILMIILSSCISVKPLSESNPEYDAFCNESQINGMSVLRTLSTLHHHAEVTALRIQLGKDTVTALENKNQKIIVEVEHVANKGRIFKINPTYFKNLEEIDRERYLLIILCTVSNLSGAGSDESSYIFSSDALLKIIHAVYGDASDASLVNWTDEINKSNMINDTIIFKDDMMLLKEKT